MEAGKLILLLFYITKGYMLEISSPHCHEVAKLH